MYESDFTFTIQKAVSESEKLGWPLFFVLYLSEKYQEEYRKFCIICRGLKAPISWLLPIGPNHLALPVFDEIYAQIKQDFPDTMVGTGVNAYFAELNRTRPSIEKADFVSFTISPQVHAFDNFSLVENLDAQAEVIRSAKTLFPQKPIFVSPVSLRQRFNVVATSAEPSPLPGQLPSSVDIRQRSIFAAQWTLGSIKFLSQAGAELITYYETAGWKGWIQGEQQPAEHQLFQAKANEIFPIYHALRRLAGYSTLYESTSSHPLLFDGLAISNHTEVKLLLFNFTAEPIVVSLEPSIFPKMINSLVYSEIPNFSNGKCHLRAGDLIEIKV